VWADGVNHKNNVLKVMMNTLLKRILKAFIPKFIRDILMNNKYIRLFKLKITSEKRLAKRDLLRFDIHLADHCNLKCKGCLHFSPLAPEIYQDVDILEQDCRRLSELTSGRVADICVLGGEPLLHPRITDCLDIARKYFPLDRIYIVTNGLLLQKQPQTFWENCVKNNIGIDVSLYPIHLELKKLKETAQGYGVKLSMRGDSKSQTRSWMRQTLDLKGGQNIEQSHKMCEMANYCVQLIKGKLYQCETTAFIKYFNEYFNKNLDVTEKDYINIYQAKNQDEILEFLCKPTPFCCYCKTKDVNFVKWEHTKKEIKEWV
jgi:MoaA/NifB/PqqE/SkfB family radical SAM enzyme